MDAYELIVKVGNWSQRDDRVIAAGVCGSYARGEARPDSDTDFCIVSVDPNCFLENRSWVTEFGSDARVAGAVEGYNLVQSIRVFYGALEVEFGVADRTWMELPIDRETASVMRNGLRILYDPEGRLEKAVAHAASLPLGRP